MPRRDDIVRTLRAHEAELRARGVDALYLFGSVVRDEAGPDSDVDLFFDYRAAKFSLVELVTLQDVVSDLVGSAADVMTRGSIHPGLRSRIEREALRVF